MTDTSTLDEYNARQEAKRSPLDRSMMEMFQRNINRTDLMYEFLSEFEPWNDEEKEIWADRQDKIRVFWADQYELNYGPVLDLHTWNSRHECEGCDFSGAEGEPPEWPCRTVYAATGHATTYEPLFKTFEPRLKPKKKNDGKYVTFNVHTSRNPDGTVNRDVAP